MFTDVRRLNMGERMNDELIAVELETYAKSLGVELYGVASASGYKQEFPDKPAPSQFLDGAQSIIVIGYPFEPGTVATVLRPELAGLKGRAADEVGTSGVQPVGAERFFLGEEDAMLSRELSHSSYLIAKYLRLKGW